MQKYKKLKNEEWQGERMNENGGLTCAKHEEHERRITELEEDIDNINDKVNKLDKDLAVTTTSILQTLEGLKRLPEVLDSIKDTMTGMQTTIVKTGQKTDDLATQVKSLSDTVKTMDDEGKFNIREFIKKHWVSIILVLGALVWFANTTINLNNALLK